VEHIRVTGEVDQHHQLVAKVPDSIAPGPVDVVILPPSTPEDDVGEGWMAGIAEEWQEELADPRQDIYSLSDGVPVDGSR
jgi:hypothetical protein